MIPNGKNKVMPEAPAWLIERRKLLLGASAETPLPSKGLHLWRYTDPAHFAFQEIVPNTSPNMSDDAARAIDLHASGLSEEHISALLLDRAGVSVEVRLSHHGKATGIVALPLSVAVQSHRSLLEEHLYSLINSRFGKFESMNGALWHEGLFVYIPDNTVVNNPIVISRDAGTTAGSCYYRTLIVIGKDSEATIIDEYLGGPQIGEAGAYVSASIEIVGLSGSRTRYVNIQGQNPGVSAYVTHRARVDQDAAMVTIPLVFGGAVVKQIFGVNLSGKGADSKMAGLLFGTGHQHLDNHTLHHHQAGQTTSNIDFKVALKDKAMSAYTGLIRIDKTAKHCEAYQENRNLLLNTGTRAETIPELEILNEDVSCTHGATVGPLDPQQIFYLKCRGISHEDAIRMIVSGYVASTFGLLPEDLRERVATYVSSRLEKI